MILMYVWVVISLGYLPPRKWDTRKLPVGGTGKNVIPPSYNGYYE
jgi:hypothetical protein